MPKRLKTEIAYHFTGDVLRDGRPLPKIGKWLREDGDIKICVKGLHASRTPFQALNYAPGFKLHKVEIADIVDEQDDKLVARRRRIIATIDAKDLILAFARKQALSVAHLYDCPPVLKEWLETGDPTIQEDAAEAANAAIYAAEAANAADPATGDVRAAIYAIETAFRAAKAANAAIYAAEATASVRTAIYTIETAFRAANAAAYAVYTTTAPASAERVVAEAIDASNASNADAADAKQKAVVYFNEMMEDAFAKAVKGRNQ